MFSAKDLLGNTKSIIKRDIMNFFSIDCSADIGSLFVKIESKTFSKILQSDKYNNDLLMKQILDFFDENALNLNDVSQIFVNQGPGNFSGLRSSLAIAKGISISKNLHLYGYDTFILSCAKFFNKKNFIYSIIEFRGKFFIKKFNKKLKSTSNVIQTTKEDIVKNYKNEFKVAPIEIKKYFDLKTAKINNINFVNLDHKHLEFLQLKGLLNESLIKPIYLG